MHACGMLFGIEFIQVSTRFYFLCSFFNLFAICFSLPYCALRGAMPSLPSSALPRHYPSCLPACLPSCLPSRLPACQPDERMLELHRSPYPRSTSLFLTSLSSHHFEYMLERYSQQETADGTVVALHRCVVEGVAGGVAVRLVIRVTCSRTYGPHFLVMMIFLRRLKVC